MTAALRVAVLGTGIMGMAMARNLRKAGHAVTVWNRTQDRARPITEVGGAVAETPRDATTGADAVVTMLSDGAAVEAAMTGPQGALAGMAGGALWLQMSTVGVAATDRLAALAAGAPNGPVGFVDAPVLGTRQPAEAGTLTVIASGEPALQARAAPVFDAVGERTLWIAGAPGTSARLKLVANQWSTGMVALLAETVTLARALGIEPRQFFDMVQGTPFTAPYAQLKGQHMMAGEFPPSFPLDMAHKDVRLALAAASDAGCELPVTRAIERQYAAADARGRGRDDLSAIVTALDPPAWPRKTREFHNHHFDSTVWNHFTPRRDDIVIATYAKSGTTWMQQIVSQLLFDGAEGLEVARMSPCVEHRVPPRDVKLPLLEAQTHRRFLKTHLAVDALVFHPSVKYIHVARDGRDAVWSMHNHHMNANQVWYDTLNKTPGLVGYPMPPANPDVRAYFLEWLERDGYPFWPFWVHARTWWQARSLPNVLSVHYAELVRDLAGQIRRIAAFLDVTVAEASWPRIVEHCSFDYMKQHATKSLPFEGKFWDDGAKTFVNKGVNGRWRDALTADEIARYDAVAERELGPACARWFALAERG